MATTSYRKSNRSSSCPDQLEILSERALTTNIRGGMILIKKFSFSLSLFLFGLFLFSSSSTLANGETGLTEKSSTLTNDVETEIIEVELNLEDLTYVEVSEERVILDYMLGKKVGREVAIRELGINKLEKNYSTTMYSSCTTAWRYYNTPRVKIDSSAHLTVHPYIHVKTCGGVSGFKSFIGVSSVVNYTLDNMMGGIRFDGGIQAQLNGSNRVQVAAKGHVRNFLGIKLRNWIFNSTIYAMPEISAASHNPK